MLHTILRIAIQLALTAPMLLYFPFAVIMLVATVLSLGDPASMTLKAIAPSLGAFGIAGLFTSILAPLAWQRRPAPRAVITVLLIAGIVTAVVYAFHEDGGGRVVDSAGLWQLYLLGGPVVVALWNLWRMYVPLPAAPAPAAAPSS